MEIITILDIFMTCDRLRVGITSCRYYNLVSTNFIDLSILYYYIFVHDSNSSQVKEVTNITIYLNIDSYVVHTNLILTNFGLGYNILEGLLFKPITKNRNKNCSV